MLEIIRDSYVLIEQRRMKEMAEMFIAGFGAKLSASFATRMIDYFDRMSEEHIIAFLHHMQFVESMSRLEDLVDLGKIEVDTMLITGAMDTIVTPEDVLAVANRMKKCKCHVEPLCGHFLHFEDQSVLQHYKDFYKQISL